jgi:hypothetical protein
VPVKSVLTSWFLLLGLLLQSVVWALPAHRAGQAQRLAHEVAHALDHWHHPHDETDRDVAPMLEGPQVLSQDENRYGPHHVHASESAQLQGLPTAAALSAPTLPLGVPGDGTSVLPPSADPDGLLRPPRFLI